MGFVSNFTKGCAATAGGEVAGFALQSTTTSLSLPASAVSYDNTAATKSKWLAYGRSDASTHGMVGDPTSEEIAVMTFGSYLTLIGSDANDNRLQLASPVVVYQVSGDIPSLQGFGSGDGSTNIEGLILVYDGITSNPLNSTALVQGKSGKLDFSFIPADRGISVQANILQLPTMVQAMTPENSLGNNGDDDDILPLPVAP